MKQKKEPSAFEKKMNDFIAQYLTSVPLVQKLFFVDHLRVMVKAGLSLIEALDVMSKEMENAKLKLVVGELKADVEKGTQLSEAMKKHPKVFPTMYIHMIEAGEVAGKMEEALEQVEIQMRKSHELTSAVRGAMIYPAVVLTAMLSVGVMMAVFVLPKLLEVFKEFDAELPLMTRILIQVIDVTKEPLNMVMIVGVLVGLVAAFIYGLKKSPGFKHGVHTMNVHLPIAGKIIKKINLARFSLTLSSLLKSTIPIIDATDITAETCGNVLYRDALHKAAEEIKTGKPLSEILSRYEKLFPPMVTEMVMVGERSGQVDQLLEELANFYNDDVSKTMKNFSTIIEPVIILILGVAVAVMAVAVIMPMYSLAQSF